MQDVLSKPVELIDQDLDAVAGGDDVNISFVDISQSIDQDQFAFLNFHSDVDQRQSATNFAAVAVDQN